MLSTEIGWATVHQMLLMLVFFCQPNVCISAQNYSQHPTPKPILKINQEIYTSSLLHPFFSRDFPRKCEKTKCIPTGHDLPSWLVGCSSQGAQTSLRLLRTARHNCLHCSGLIRAPPSHSVHRYLIFGQSETSLISWGSNFQGFPFHFLGELKGVC